MNRELASFVQGKITAVQHVFDGFRVVLNEPEKEDLKKAEYALNRIQQSLEKRTQSQFEGEIV